MRLTVARATPAISWPPPEPIPCGEALGAAQLNATASVPGTFAYAPAAGEVARAREPGAQSDFHAGGQFELHHCGGERTAHRHRDIANRDRPGLPRPPFPTATPLGDAQLNATASVPGSFVYTPAAGHVLAPGKYTLSVAFTPADPGKYATAQATAELVVEEPPTAVYEHVASEPVQRPPTPMTEIDAPSNAELEAAASSNNSTEINPRETRTYRGAVYEKGEDGQWHLQQS